MHFEWLTNRSDPPVCLLIEACLSLFQLCDSDHDRLLNSMINANTIDIDIDRYQ